MRFLILCLSFLFSVSLFAGQDLLPVYASQVPKAKLDATVAEFLKNELHYAGDFVSDYTLAEYKETVSGDVWYILDGYFTLPTGEILFLDFNYVPARQWYQPIRNYVFVPEENIRFLLKAEEVCNPYKRHYIGVFFVQMQDFGHLDELAGFIRKEFRIEPVYLIYGVGIVVQDTTRNYGATPEFTLKEEAIIASLQKQSYVVEAKLIPSGRSPSNSELQQRYVGVTPACQK